MSNVSTGCNFDSLTTKATHGKNIVAMISTATEDQLLAMQGQQGLSFSMSRETSSSAVKGDEGDWTVNFAGIGSWEMSCDGLWCMGDEGRKAFLTHLANGKPVCAGIWQREAQEDGSVKYTPIRKGLAIPTGDEIDAPHDDSATYSCSFTGSGKPWMIETATEDEIAAMVVVVPAPAAGEESQG